VDISGRVSVCGGTSVNKKDWGHGLGKAELILGLPCKRRKIERSVQKERMG
jgi:hypothetical protein